MGGRLSPLSQCLSGSFPHCLNVSAGPPLILQTPRRLSPLSQCLSGSSSHPPNPALFVPIVSMSQRVLPSSSKPRVVVPIIVSMSQRVLPSSSKPAPFVPIVSMSQRVLPSSSKPRAVCPHRQWLLLSSPNPALFVPLSQCPSSLLPDSRRAPLGLPTDHRFPTNAPKIPCGLLFFNFLVAWDDRAPAATSSVQQDAPCCSLLYS